MFALHPRHTFHQPRHELDDAALRRSAPSIFAGQAMAGVSDRYAFLPTAQVVDRMRAAGGGAARPWTLAKGLDLWTPSVRWRWP